MWHVCVGGGRRNVATLLCPVSDRGYQAPSGRVSSEAVAFARKRTTRSSMGTAAKVIVACTTCGTLGRGNLIGGGAMGLGADSLREISCGFAWHIAQQGFACEVILIPEPRLVTAARCEGKGTGRAARRVQVLV